ncbi:uncharacterized protein LOC116690974 [Etheostoma spectabile]|uniref:uncharacterized protein LOC116690974 n=1 Tax=Etheostoma spectabile TaxID=54343 RepID=UPI0013AF5768|nr:uncharacterized protein LOC116690974 [Etheostoma spectabile]
MTRPESARKQAEKREKPSGCLLLKGLVPPQRCRDSSGVTHTVRPAASNSGPTKTICGSVSGFRGRAETKRKRKRKRRKTIRDYTSPDHKPWWRTLTMNRLNPDCWLWSPATPLGLLPHHSGTLASAMLGHGEEEEEEEEEEEAGEHPAACCYNTGCDDVISRSAGARRSVSDPPPTHSGIISSSSSSSSPAAAPPPQLPKPVVGADGADVADVAPHYTGGRCWGGPGTETQRCVCGYGQRQPEGLGSCWSGSPYVYYGVRRNLVVGVEVVEEVAVEDTLEVITEDMYNDDLLDPELLQHAQLYPT